MASTTSIFAHNADKRACVTDLGEHIIGLAGRLTAATTRWLQLVAEFDRDDGATSWGFPSTTRWLMHFCGHSRRTASDHVRVARALVKHDQLADAMSSGRVSFSHARAISRVADVAEPTLIDELIMTAENGTVDQLETVVRGLRTVEQQNHSEERAAPRETLVHAWDDDARWRCTTRLQPENGELVTSALKAVAAREDISAAEALTRIAEIALAVLADAEGELPTLRGDERAAVVVHLHPTVTAPVADGGSAEPPVPDGHIHLGPGLSDEVVNRLACDGRIRTVVHDGEGNPLDVGRTHRTVSKKQFRALLLRDGGCTHPGCGSRLGLEAHHVQHWLHGGRTDMANLALLCRRHHHAHHDGEFTIRPIEGQRFEFLRNDGLRLYVPERPADATDEADPSDAEYDRVAPAAATTRWDGTRLDRSYAVSVLARRLRTSEAANPEAAAAQEATAAGVDPWAA